jgi:hypothetical protein
VSQVVCQCTFNQFNNMLADVWQKLERVPVIEPLARVLE